MAQNSEHIKTNTAEETKEFAEKLALSLHGGDVLLLYGDLGYGKTTFVQGLAKGLGLTQKIISPTFLIMRKYISEGQKKDIKNFYHVDLYRIENEAQVIELGLVDIMKDKDTITVIEWPEKMGSLLPENCILVRFEYLDENRRGLLIERK